MNHNFGHSLLCHQVHSWIFIYRFNFPVGVLQICMYIHIYVHTYSIKREREREIGYIQSKGWLYRRPMAKYQYEPSFIPDGILLLNGWEPSLSTAWPNWSAGICEWIRIYISTDMPQSCLRKRWYTLIKKQDLCYAMPSKSNMLPSGYLT